MKKFALLSLTFAAVLAAVLFAAEAPVDQRTVLATSTANGVTTTLYVSRVQTDPSPAGGATLTVFPDRVLTDSAGNVLASGLTQSFTVTLTAQQYAGISAIITSAYAAQNPQ